MGLDAFAALLDEFRRGNIGNGRDETEALERHLKPLTERWDQRFPGFPRQRWAHASLMGVARRGVRDKYLKEIIAELLQDEMPDLSERVIVNPVCVIGRHARDLARRLPSFKVIATDIDPWPNRLYGCQPWVRTPGNFEFRKDSVYDPKLDVRPAAVVFFGACGSVSDGAMDYAISSGAAYLICRTCCHDNIGRNTQIRKKLTALNWFFRFKNFLYARIRDMWEGFYFSQKYSREEYPRSEAARRLSNSDEFIEISRNSVNSDIYRAIIDLDRYLRLAEQGYDVRYRGELFFAEKSEEPCET